MSDPIHHLRVLHNNPFIFAPVFSAFFEELGEKQNALLLGYLVLPMTLHQPSRAFLQNAKRNSSVRTMLRDRTRILGVGERVDRYRVMTNTTLQYLLDTGGISCDRQLSVLVASQATDGSSPEGVVKAARRLGSLFGPYDVTMVFRTLGVISL